MYFVTLPDAHHGHHDLAVMIGPHVCAIIMSPDVSGGLWAIKIYDQQALRLPRDTAGKLISARSFEEIETWLGSHFSTKARAA